MASISKENENVEQANLRLIKENVQLKKERKFMGGFLILFSLIVSFFAIIISGPPTPESDAPSKVSAYRNPLVLPLRVKAYGIHWDKSEIQSYLNNFDKYVSETGVSPYNDTNHPIPGYKWSIGFYWTFKKVNGHVKLSYTLVPTLVSTSNPNTVIDYFDDINQRTKIYNHTYDNDVARANAKDNGQLWP